VSTVTEPVHRHALNDAQLIEQLNSGAPVNAAVPAATSPWPGANGAGQTVGLVEFDSYNPSDVADYLNLTGAPASELNNLSKVDIDGGTTPGAGEDEVLLDIDTVMTIAKGAKVVVYDAPFSGPGNSFQSVFNAAINGGATIISNSWAYCEDQTTQADVDSIDTIFQNAAVSDISIFNGAGDSGSTCLDGAPNTIAVPADSPNATAVGGSSLTLGDGATYGSETWWNDSATTPPAGQGGFGVSKFFTAPGYQKPFVAMRSIPDVVANADPFHGIQICQADNGGCPSGLQYGGTSMSAPEWAAFTALLNQAQGHNLGFLNPLIYPFSATNAFHSAASMGSDFAHVGLGSPDLPVLNQMLASTSTGAVDPSKSRIVMTGKGPFVPEGALFPAGQPADGSSKLFLSPHIYDSNGNPVSGKTVTVTANGGNHATITPPSATTGADGTALFTVTDSTIEDLTFTVKADGITLDQEPSVPFVAPPAVAGGIVASLGNEPADGVTADTITITLKDSLNRPTPGKTVILSQDDANSAITAPSPPITDGNGQIQFTVTDTHTENVTYTATDVTDGNLPVPGNASVDFTNGPGGCPQTQPGNVRGTVAPANGFLASTFASGFTVSSGNQGFFYNCFGAWGMAWDSSDNLYVTDWPTGKIYKFGPSGGTADASHLFTTVKAPASGVAIDPAGNMFASEASVSGPNGDIVPVDLSTGAVGTAIASGIECLGSMALNPTIPALFAIDFCNVVQGGNDNIWQVTGIDGSSPSTAVYTQVPPSNVENLQVTVAPDGTLYDLFCAGGVGCEIARVSAGSPPVVSTLMTAGGAPITLFGSLGITPGGMQPSGDAQFIIFPQPAQDGLGQGIQTIDLTGPVAAPAVQITTDFSSGLSNFAIGPDGCLYVAGGPTVSRVTKTDGTCGFGPTTQPPSISLTPSTVAPNPVQGASQNFTASFHYASVPAGTPVLLSVTGDNAMAKMARTDANGQAAFSYTGRLAGSDTVVASGVVNNTSLASNPVEVTWDPGQDTAFLTLNLSPKSGIPGNPITLVASLSDVSKNPPVPVVNESVTLGLGNDTCSAATDTHGNASCQVSPEIIPGNPSRPITADFAGNSNLTSAHASSGFMFTAPPEDAKLRVTPNALHFPAQGELGGVGGVTKPLIVHVFNPKNKKQKLTVTFLGAENTGDFTIVSGPPTTCDVSLDPKKSCKIALTFSPTGPANAPAR